MTDRAAQATPPALILVAIRDEAFRRALQSVLVSGGFQVATAEDADGTLAQIHREAPDGVLLDTAIAPPPRFAFCRTLRDDPAFTPAIPILLTSVGRPTHTEQTDALRAGAWELRGHPVDAEELLLRLGVYVEAKRAMDRVTAAALLDQSSGLYNAAGLARRSEELAAFTARHSLPLSCAVFRAPATPDAHPDGDGNQVAGAFKQEGRISDAIGRTAQDEFAVFAPATDAPAVARLVERLGQRVGARAGLVRPLQAGVSSAPAGTRPDPRELLARARGALEAR
jgi:PleD family two-component response regulator